MPKGVYSRRLKPLAERFWALVDRRGPDECWPFLGHRNEKGRGRISLGRRSDGYTYAYRVAWSLANGREVPKGLGILHSCDNPPCCNPAHLSPGTHKKNMGDCKAKGRFVQAPAKAGESNPRAKLTTEQVRLIREKCIPGSRGDCSASAFARRLAVAYPTVLRALRGKTWRDVSGERRPVAVPA
jgi:hypothetical protein